MKKRTKRRTTLLRRGVLTFEWLLLITVVVIGIVSGIGAIRDALINEMEDMVSAIDALYVDPNAP